MRLRAAAALHALLALPFVAIACFPLLSGDRAATSDMAGVTSGWPSPLEQIDDRLRGPWQTIYRDLKANPENYVGFHHSGDRITVEVPPGQPAGQRRAHSRLLIAGPVPRPAAGRCGS